jgi:uncharacterized RDD family membrane protein YckC
MTRLRIPLTVLLLAAAATMAAAQEPAVAPPLPPAPPEVTVPQAPDLPPAPDFPDPPPSVDIFDARGERGALRIGQGLNVAADEAVREAVVIFGDATIAGQVDNDLVVILGRVRLESTAAVGGSFVAVGGDVDIEQGAAVRRDMVIVGGNLDAPGNFSPGGEHVVVGTGVVGGWLADVGPYFARGPLWGRLIVPEIPWVWTVVALFFLVYLALNLVFEGPVRACAATLRARPLTAFGVGLLVLLLFGPVSMLLAVSVIGIVVVPFVVCAMLAAWIVGKVAVARWIGMSVATEEIDNRTHATRSFVIGFVLIAVAYSIPILGIITWAIVGVLGLGAASLAFVSAYRRENPRPVVPPSAVPPPAVPPPPVPTPYTPATGAVPAAPAPMAYDAAAAAPAPEITDPGLPPMMPAEPIPAIAGAPAIAASGLAATMPRAQFRDRLAAFVLDIILVAITVNVFDNVFFFMGGADDLFPPLFLAYFVAFWTWKQTTVGGIICQLRVVRVDGAPLSFADALVRGLSAIFSLAVLFIGALWILRDPERQAWHDKIAGTYVVKVPRNWPL